MGRLKPFSVLVLVVGAAFLIIGLWFVFDMTHYTEVRDFELMKMVSQGVTFSISGGFLIIIGLILKGLIDKTVVELQDLKNEIHRLRKEMEDLKK